MDFKKYENNMPYPDKANYTTIGYVDTRSDSVVYLGKKEVAPASYVKFKEDVNQEAYAVYRKKYYDYEAELHDQFFKDLLEDYGLDNNKFSQALLSIAWSEAHSEGLSAVSNYLGNICHLYGIAKETFSKEK